MKKNDLVLNTRFIAGHPTGIPTETFCRIVATKSTGRGKAKESRYQITRDDPRFAGMTWWVYETDIRRAGDPAKHDPQAEFSAMCRKAASEANRSFTRNGCYAHYLYYKPQGMELTMATEQPEGFELGDPQAQRGSLTEDQLTRWIEERARRLPILKPY